MNDEITSFKIGKVKAASERDQDFVLVNSFELKYKTEFSFRKTILRVMHLTLSEESNFSVTVPQLALQSISK